MIIKDKFLFIIIKIKVEMVVTFIIKEKKCNKPYQY
jgi:hypothetical protein